MLGVGGVVATGGSHSLISTNVFSVHTASQAPVLRPGVSIEG